MLRSIAASTARYRVALGAWQQQTARSGVAVQQRGVVAWQWPASRRGRFL